MVFASIQITLSAIDFDSPSSLESGIRPKVKLARWGVPLINKDFEGKMPLISQQDVVHASGLGLEEQKNNLLKKLEDYPAVKIVSITSGTGYLVAVVETI